MLPAPFNHISYYYGVVPDHRSVPPIQLSSNIGFKYRNILETLLKLNERTNEVKFNIKFNMRLRLRVSDSEGNFRQPPQNGVDNCGVRRVLKPSR